MEYLKIYKKFFLHINIVFLENICQPRNNFLSNKIFFFCLSKTKIGGNFYIYFCMINDPSVLEFFCFLLFLLLNGSEICHYLLQDICFCLHRLDVIFGIFACLICPRGVFSSVQMLSFFHALYYFLRCVIFSFNKRNEICKWSITFFEPPWEVIMTYAKCIIIDLHQIFFKKRYVNCIQKNSLIT